MHLLGDPHLGKKFIRGVPLERRDEREQSQWTDFCKSLESAKGLHVCMGDLFDKSVVPYRIVLQAAEAYKRASPDAEFVVLRGNHDGSRDAEFISAYDVFAALLSGLKNIHVLQDEPLVLQDYLFVPWHPFKAAADLIPKGKFKAAFGHWDVIDFGNDNPNLIPIAQLKEVCNEVYTGHDHDKRDIIIDGVPVHVVGSMQPYSHAEDREGKLYVTVTPDELKDIGVKNKCVRVLLKKGEEIPVGLDCLQLTIKRVEEEVPEDLQVELGAFDLRKLFSESFSEEGVEEELTTHMWERFSASSN